jgi:hypothetical protein
VVRRSRPIKSLERGEFVFVACRAFAGVLRARLEDQPERGGCVTCYAPCFTRGYFSGLREMKNL